MLDHYRFIVCIYRSLYSELHDILYKLEVVINRVKVKNKQLILSGEWNVNFLQQSKKLLYLQDLLLRHFMVNTVESPTRSFNNSTLFFDVMVTDKSCKTY
jgi:hypothetical protein